MPWFYDSRTGAYAEEAGVLGWISNIGSKLGLGWHEYATKAEMYAAVKKNHWPPPTTDPSDPIGKTAAGSVESTAAGNLLGIQLPSFLQIGEVLVGAILLFVALNSMTNGGAQQAATVTRQVAKRAVKKVRGK
jgi:hypothetical protein